MSRSPGRSTGRFILPSSRFCLAPQPFNRGTSCRDNAPSGVESLSAFSFQFSDITWRLLILCLGIFSDRTLPSFSHRTVPSQELQHR